MLLTAIREEIVRLSARLRDRVRALWVRWRG